MGFGKEIKRLRQDVPISVSKIAIKIGVDSARWRKWEEKDLDPRFEDTQLIEDFFSMPLCDVAQLASIKEFLKVPREIVPTGNSQSDSIEAKNKKLEEDNRFLQSLITLRLGKIEANLKTLEDLLYMQLAKLKTFADHQIRLEAKGNPRKQISIAHELDKQTAGNLASIRRMGSHDHDRDKSSNDKKA